MSKEFIAWGLASQEYDSSELARGNTYTTRDGVSFSTPLIFQDNPFNDRVKNAKVILDLGCGIGRNREWILNNTNATYIGLEPNPAMRKYFVELQGSDWQNRTILAKDFSEIPKDIKIDVVVCTYVFQHVGYRTPDTVMNITDITLEVNKFCNSDVVWIMYEHDWEEAWIERWLEETKMHKHVFKKEWIGIPELTHRGKHHLLICTPPII